jgi:hypothetical protein
MKAGGSDRNPRAKTGSFDRRCPTVDGVIGPGYWTFVHPEATCLVYDSRLTGKLNWNVAPALTLFAAWSRPPCASMMVRAMARPIHRSL